MLVAQNVDRLALAADWPSSKDSAATRVSPYHKMQVICSLLDEGRKEAIIHPILMILESFDFGFKLVDPSILLSAAKRKSTDRDAIEHI